MILSFWKAARAIIVTPFRVFDTNTSPITINFIIYDSLSEFQYRYIEKTIVQADAHRLSLAYVELATKMSKLYYKNFGRPLIFFAFYDILYIKVAT